MILKERIIWVLIISVILTGIIHYFRRNAEDFNRFEHMHFWIEKTYSPKRYNVIIGGDSRAYRGLSPDDLQMELPGCEIFNFGYSSGSFSPYMLSEIEKRLTGSPSKRIVILGITPYSLTQKAAMDEHIRQEFARKKEEVIQYRYCGFLLKIFEPLQAVSFKQSVKAGINIPAQPVYHEEFYPDNGWVASWKTPSDSTEALEPYSHSFENNRVSDELIQVVIGKTKEWRGKGIHIFGFFPPTTLAMNELENRLSGFDRDGFINQFMAAGGDWIYVNLGDHTSYDGSHLTKESAIRLSHQVGKNISTVLNSKASKQ